MNFIKFIYDHIRLNLGIKRGIRSSIILIWDFFDRRIIYPAYLALSQYTTLRIIDHYGGDYKWGDERSQNLDKKHGNLGYGLVHKALVRNLRPKRILCIGSMYGYIPYMMASACAENQYGHVDFVDAGFNIKDKRYRQNHFFGQGFWNHVDLENHFSYLTNGKYITSYIMTSKEFHKRYDYTYDYIYLDGDHSYKGAARDIKLFWPRLSQGGLLCLHDIHFDFKKSLEHVDEEFLRSVGSVRFEMNKVWKALWSLPYKFDISNGYSGIGFVQKLGKSRLPPL